jgi:hypothetical protein
MAHSPHARSEARSGKRSCGPSATLGSPLLWQNLHLLYIHYSNGHASLSKLPASALGVGGECCRADRRPLLLPTTYAKAPRAFWRRPPPLVSLRSWLLEKLSFVHDALDPSPLRRDPGCSERCPPGASAKHLVALLGNTFLTGISIC